MAWQVRMGRAVYDENGLVGIMDTAELAERVVAAVNDFEAARPRCPHVEVTPWAPTTGSQCCKEAGHEHHAYSPSEALDQA